MSTNYSKILFALAIGLVVLGGWHVLSLFPVDTVRVTASYQYVSQTELQEVITPYVVDQGLMQADLSGLHQALEAIPWVETALLHRVWPGTVVIAVQEKDIRAQWNNEWLLTDMGEIVPAKPGVTLTPQLIGPKGKQKQLLHEYQNMSRILASLGLTITQLERSSFDTWRVVLNNGITIVLGNTQLSTRLQRFVDVYPQIVNSPNANPQRVDLRYPNAMAIYWNEENV